LRRDARLASHVKVGSISESRTSSGQRSPFGATERPRALIAAGISLAIIAAVNGLGTNLNGKFKSINPSLR
jgi:pilus assembly protein Flp/PilA